MMASQDIRFDFHALFHCEGLSSFSSFLMTLWSFGFPPVLLAWKGAAAFWPNTTYNNNYNNYNILYIYIFELNQTGTT